MSQPAAAFPQPTPEQASQIVDRLLQLLEKGLEWWMKTPASTFQEQALRSLLPQFLPSLQNELRKQPVGTVQILVLVHLALGKLLTTDPMAELSDQQLLAQLAELAQPPSNGRE